VRECENIRAVLSVLRCDASTQVTVVILDRPRHKGASLLCEVSLTYVRYDNQMLERRSAHADIIQECRDVGCRIRLISDGDVAAAVEVAKAGSAADIMFGIGGTPEGKLPVSAECSEAAACSGHDR